MSRHLLTLLTFLATLLPNVSEAAVVAHWEFADGANFLSDSSGNGYHLQDPGIAGFVAPTFSPDKPESLSVGGSAQFNGTSSFTHTVVPLLLANYNAVSFSYWMKVETTAPDLILFENSYDTNFQVNAGGTMHIVNASGLPGSTELIGYRTGVGFPSQATPLDLAFFDTNDAWHFVQVDYNFLESNADDRIKISIDGIQGQKFRSTGVQNWSHLRDDFLFVGGRREFAGDPTLLFTGKIADVKIEASQPFLRGDYNNDGHVDAADYVVWRVNVGTMNALPNDSFGGTVGDAQYTQWRANFGSVVGSGSLANYLVPEPSVLVLSAACGSAALLFFRSRPLRRKS